MSSGGGAWSVPGCIGGIDFDAKAHGELDVSWKMIPGFCLYEAHPDGLIRRIGRDQVMKPVIREGYWRVGITSESGKRRFRSVHDLIFMTFVGPRPSAQHEGAHGNGDASDNSLANLSWKTRAENAVDKQKHGTHRNHAGADSGWMTPEQVQVIRERAAKKEKYAAIARDLGVHRYSVARIARGIRQGTVQP